MSAPISRTLQIQFYAIYVTSQYIREDCDRYFPSHNHLLFKDLARVKKSKNKMSPNSEKVLFDFVNHVHPTHESKHKFSITI